MPGKIYCENLHLAVVPTSRAQRGRGAHAQAGEEANLRGAEFRLSQSLAAEAPKLELEEETMRALLEQTGGASNSKPVEQPEVVALT